MKQRFGWRSFYALSFIVLLVLANIPGPLFDDWEYLTTPNPLFTLQSLLPGAGAWYPFWRPFDALFGAVLAHAPQLFPFANHLVVVGCHIISAMLLEKIGRKLELSNRSVVFATTLFMFGAGSFATVLSPDGINQALSLMFGLLALYLYAYGSLRARKPLAFFLCILSVLAKESGIVWAVLLPVFESIQYVRFSDCARNAVSSTKEKGMRLLQGVAAGLTIGIAYLIVRLVLSPQAQIGMSDGRFALSLSPLSIAQNTGLLLGSALTSVDLIGLFMQPPSYVLFILTFVLSLVTLLLFVIPQTVIVLRDKRTRYLACVLIFMAICTTIPHAIMTRTWEMLAYPTFALVALYSGLLLDHVPSRSKKGGATCVLIALTCLLCGTLITNVHKFSMLVAYSQSEQALTQQMVDALKGQAPGDIKLYAVNADAYGYSIFLQTPIKATCFGQSLRPHNGWYPLDITVEHLSIEGYPRRQDLAQMQQYIATPEMLSAFDRVWLVYEKELIVLK